ncbi:molecular chaperone [Phaeovulum sp.]|uniref:TorD/DmsD family molecular chaperone n=1 Tax=Phaeovulum sp. TaxID=2934796 RepID=UPI0035656BE7
MKDQTVKPTALPERATLLRWLAGVFAKEQTPETLAALGTDASNALLREAADAAGLRDELGGLLALVATRPDVGPFALDLATDYARLFLGAGSRGITVQPYESYHTNPRGALFQEATGAMEALLREYGLAASGTKEPADHVAVELEFLAQLTADLAEGGEPRAAVLRDKLLREHVLVWVPGFCNACIERDRQGFYAAAARLLQSLLRAETERLASAT